MIKDELEDEIRQAFANQGYPGDWQIVYDNSGTHWECERAREAFKGKLWQSLDDNFLIDSRQDLLCFSHEGFRYYLPAFLLLTINDFDGSDDLPFNLVTALTLPTEMDVAVMAQAINSTKLVGQMPSINFHEILQNQLRYTDQDVHNFIARFSLFTSEQSKAVKHFIEFIQKEYESEFFHNEPARAIERYWFQFE